VCTRCAQNNLGSCNEDGVSDKVSDSISSAGIDDVSDGIEKIGISNDDDDELFQDPPPKEDCQICFLPMPYCNAPRGASIFGASPMYQPCCGKVLCTGCMVTSVEEMKEGNIKDLCPYCRVSMYRSKKEYLKRVENRTDLNDAEAFYYLGLAYERGQHGLQKDHRKAFQLLNRAAELGSTNGHNSLALAYIGGEGVEEDEERAKHHMVVAAIGGHERARYNLGIMEGNNGNVEPALKHFIIAARCGFDKALKKVGVGYKAGHVSKDEYANVLRAYQASVDEMKSEQRTTVECILVQE